MTHIDKEAIRAIQKRIGSTPFPDGFQDTADDASVMISDLEERVEKAESMLRNVVWRATCGTMQYTGQSLNDICVKITSMRNSLYLDGKAQGVRDGAAILPHAYRAGMEASAVECEELGARTMSQHGSQMQEDCYTNAAKAIRALPVPHVDLAEQCKKEIE